MQRLRNGKGAEPIANEWNSIFYCRNIIKKGLFANVVWLLRLRLTSERFSEEIMMRIRSSSPSLSLSQRSTLIYVYELFIVSHMAEEAVKDFYDPMRSNGATLTDCR